MRNYLVFLRKEVMELLRTKRLLGLFGVFAFFALTSPLLARYMVEFLGHFVPSDELLLALIPDPIWIDSYTQFYSNVAQIGAIAIIMMFMGIIATEKSRGTADLMITKGLSYTNFVLAKFTVAATALLLTTLVSIGVVYFYTSMLFPTAGAIGNVIGGTLVYTLLMTAVLAITLLCSAISKSNIIAALLSLLGYFVISFIRSLPGMSRSFLPGNLSERCMEITLTGTVHPDLLGNVLVTVGLIAVCLALSVLVLKRKEGA